MDISKSSFLQFTNKKNYLISDTPVATSKINHVANIYPQEQADTRTIGKCTVNAYGNYLPVVNFTKFSTTYSSFTPAELSKIKQLIYNLHNQGEDINQNNNDNDQPVVSTKKTFIGSEYDNFCDAETLFNYLEKSSDGLITKDTGITRTQLVALTQKDSFEDANYDFFGTLNRIFDNTNFNTNGDNTLSFDEIDAFIGKELGEASLYYLDKVNEYSDEIQAEYDSLSAQEKLEFVIDKTQKYLECAGLTKQLEALNRLSNEQDTYNNTYSAKVGQIVMTDIESEIDGYITLGAYSYIGFNYTFENNDTTSTYPYTGLRWGYDYDESDFDGGITLNKEMLNYEWYYLVDTLVHELTHATAYQYFPNPACEKSEDDKYYLYNDISQLEKIKDVLEKDGLYEFYRDNFNEINSNDMIIPFGVHSGESANKRLKYLIECKWGEYTAYQTDADYIDSIAGDIFNSSTNLWGNSSITTAAEGKDEAESIKVHITEGYNTAGMTLEEYATAYGVSVDTIKDNDNNGKISYGDVLTTENGDISIYSKEVMPDWKWWSYA